MEFLSSGTTGKIESSTENLKIKNWRNLVSEKIQKP